MNHKFSMAEAFNRCGTYETRRRRQVHLYEPEMSEYEFGRSIERQSCKLFSF